MPPSRKPVKMNLNAFHKGHNEGEGDLPLGPSGFVVAAPLSSYFLEPRMTIEGDASTTTESALASGHAMMSPAELMTVNGDNLEADAEVVFGAAILGGEFSVSVGPNVCSDRGRDGGRSGFYDRDRPSGFDRDRPSGFDRDRPSGFDRDRGSGFDRDRGSGFGDRPRGGGGGGGFDRDRGESRWRRDDEGLFMWKGTSRFFL